MACGRRLFPKEPASPAILTSHRPATLARHPDATQARHPDVPAAILISVILSSELASVAKDLTLTELQA
jgi:hypothetical protein